MALALLVASLSTGVSGEESVPTSETESHFSHNLQSPFQCPGAPFIVPSDNYVSANYHYCRGDECNSGPPYYNHQGIDLKLYENGQPNTTPGVVPVYAAYEGTVILMDPPEGCNVSVSLDIRHENVGGQSVVYTYYTHMANAACTESYIEVTNGKWVEQGQLIGYQGNYGASSVHLHFSVNYPGLNEYYNNQDPSPFLWLNVNGDKGASPGYITSDRCTKCCGQCCCKTSSASSFDLCASVLSSTAFSSPTATFAPSVAPDPTSTPLPTLLPTITTLPTIEPFTAWKQAVVQVNTTPPSSAHYKLARSVFGTSGGRRTSTQYVMQGTSGQTTGVERRESSHYVLQSGYWGIQSLACNLPADLDGDGEVTVADILQVANLWRCRSGDECYDEYFDMDKDGDIDIVDIMLVVVHWGETCG